MESVSPDTDFHCAELGALTVQQFDAMSAIYADHPELCTGIICLCETPAVQDLYVQYSAELCEDAGNCRGALQLLEIACYGVPLRGAGDAVADNKSRLDRCH